ncbi:hypothetical protein HNP38_001267 [Chryseobacterium defluvii]|uniref:UbiA prenyltransferase family protein n=1 Tax=Chryseobacterium defluvii TaxID=160396 RepID=A0A840KBY0_9FLAO|nr:hypothetical protein [Chryseobacterium defluvii]MBB4805995.1 hypothetical protein [Chryseobacterium defluvii]
MMKNLTILQIFYGKLLIPTVLFSLLIISLTGFSYQNFGLCFFLIFPLLHYFVYEVRLKNEYYFYANFGFSKRLLWISTLVISLIVKTITLFL